MYAGLNYGEIGAMGKDGYEEEKDARRDHSRGDRRDYKYGDWQYNDEMKRLEDESRRRYSGASSSSSDSSSYSGGSSGCGGIFAAVPMLIAAFFGFGLFVSISQGGGSGSSGVVTETPAVLPEAVVEAEAPKARPARTEPAEPADSASETVVIDPAPAVAVPPIGGSSPERTASDYVQMIQELASAMMVSSEFVVPRVGPGRYENVYWYTGRRDGVADSDTVDALRRMCEHERRPMLDMTAPRDVWICDIPRDELAAALERLDVARSANEVTTMMHEIARP